MRVSRGVSSVGEGRIQCRSRRYGCLGEWECSVTALLEDMYLTVLWVPFNRLAANTLAASSSM